METNRNRIAYLGDIAVMGWLRNTVRSDFVKSQYGISFTKPFFAGTTAIGTPCYCLSSEYLGVRPEFWMANDL